MIELSENQIKELQEFAECYLSLNELAEIMGFDVECFTSEFEREGSDIRLAIRKGRLLTKASLHKALVSSAKNGSNPSQEKLLSLITKIENTEDE